MDNVFQSQRNHKTPRLALTILTLALLLLFGVHAPAPALAETNVPLSVAALRNTDGTLRLDGTQTGTVNLNGWDVALDAARGPVLKPANATAIPGTAKWDGTKHQGLNGFVTCLLIHGTDIYVGGYFSQTYDGKLTNLHNIAKYDTVAAKWVPLARAGLDNQVLAMALNGNMLYVAGTFSQTYDGAVTGLNYVATYNLSTRKWGKFAHDGLSGNAASALAFRNGILYVGGDFTQTYDGAVTDLNYLASYDTATKTWMPVANNGLNGAVKVLALAGTSLYAGGAFTDISGGIVHSLQHIAKYDTAAKTWTALANSGLNDQVNTLLVVGKTLYVGGFFSASADASVQNLNSIAAYNLKNKQWTALSNAGLNGVVFALATDGTTLFVGGQFSGTYDNGVPDLRLVARYDLTTKAWSKFPHDGLNNTVLALAADSTQLVAGGNFSKTFDQKVLNLNRIARFK